MVREVARRGIVAKISGRTIWRWLDADAIRPWQHRSWIFPRDPDFQTKAERVLDLYQGLWEGQPLGSADYVISADEKTSIQARIRLHPTLPPQSKETMRVEFEYERGGALAYLAAWDVRRAKVFGRCEDTTGIEPFGRLVQQVMEQEPYRSAARVFWMVDNGSSYRGAAAVNPLGNPPALLEDPRSLTVPGIVFGGQSIVTAAFSLTTMLWGAVDGDLSARGNMLIL